MSKLEASYQAPQEDNNEDGDKKENASLHLNNYNALLTKYIDAIKPINNRLTDLLQANSNISLITGDLNKTVNYLKNFTVAKKENVNPIPPPPPPKVEHTPPPVNNTEPEKEPLHAQYAYLRNLLRGSSLVILNKFYAKRYADSVFVGEDEEAEMLNLANKFDINIKLVRLFVKCKKTLL